MRTTSRSLRGGWTFRELDPEKHPNSAVDAWLPAVVPGFVHLDLMRAGVIADPFERMNERGVQWVDMTGWEYRCTFAVDAGDLDGARHLLRFEGLDTLATVALNGHVIGETENMFVAHEFDVTSSLRAGENIVEVRFASAQRVGDERRQAFLDEDAERRPFRHGLHARSMVRKAQYMYGWDWGPRLRSCGIWQDVSLVRVPQARIDRWSWETTFDDDGTCSVDVRVNADGDATAVDVRLRGNGVDLERSGAVESGAARLVVTIDEPARWWPAGSGDQPLYDVVITLRAGDTVVDSTTGRIGLREIELVREPDEAGESFLFRVNGVDLFAKGANWIPDDSFPTRTTRDRVHALLTLARDCGMNMVRIWGGGLYESEDFYDACDELGLLVWQDFPFACAFYPEDDAFLAAVEDEARVAIRRLRNHTSLALYCGNNEVQWLAGIGAYGRVPRVLGERIFDETLPAVCAGEDATRPYWPSSPYGTGPDRSGMDDGDCHYWNVWHGEGDWTHYTKCDARFVSEFGFAAPPALRTLQHALDPADLGVDTPGMRWHDKTSKGYETYLGYIALHYPMPSTVDDLVYYGQLNQADAMRFGIEHFRRLRPRTMGTLVWQLNDCWPVQSWAWVDYRLRPKAAWYAARRFYAPLLLSLSRDGDRIRAHLVNDQVAPRSGTLTVSAIDADGAVLWTAESPASVGPCESRQVLDAALDEKVTQASAGAVIHAAFADVEATLLLAEPKDLRLPVPQLRVEAAVDPSVPSGRAVALTVEADTLALSVMLWLDGADASWSDNFFHLLPGGRRDVVVTPEGGLDAAEVAARLRWRCL